MVRSESLSVVVKGHAARINRPSRGWPSGRSTFRPLVDSKRVTSSHAIAASLALADRPASAVLSPLRSTELHSDGRTHISAMYLGSHFGRLPLSEPFRLDG